MPVRERYGRWHIRFWVDGRPFCQPTDLAATERDKSAAIRIEAELRKLVLEGRAHELRLEIIRFNEAADKFLKWVRRRASGPREHAQAAAHQLRESSSLLWIEASSQYHRRPD